MKRYIHLRQLCRMLHPIPTEDVLLDLEVDDTAK